MSGPILGANPAFVGLTRGQVAAALAQLGQHVAVEPGAAASAELMTCFLRRDEPTPEECPCSSPSTPNPSPHRRIATCARPSAEFVPSHRTCVFGYPRRNVGPAMSVVYYVPTDDDELLVSTVADRSKALAVSRDPNVSLCVLDERWPFTYLQVYADATVDADRGLVVDVMMAVGERMTGQPLGPDARPFVEAMAVQEQRVVLRCRP